jgi:hypothetical protein
MTLFDHTLTRLTRAARARPYADQGAAGKRLRAFVNSLLRSEVRKP